MSDCLLIIEFVYYRHCNHFCFGPDPGSLDNAASDHGLPETLCEHMLAFLILFLGHQYMCKIEFGSICKNVLPGFSSVFGHLLKGLTVFVVGAG